MKTFTITFTIEDGIVQSNGKYVVDAAFDVLSSEKPDPFRSDAVAEAHLRLWLDQFGLDVNEVCKPGRAPSDGGDQHGRKGWSAPILERYKSILDGTSRDNALTSAQIAARIGCPTAAVGSHLLSRVGVDVEREVRAEIRIKKSGRKEIKVAYWWMKE